MTTIANLQTIQEVITRVWSNESLKTKLLNNPKSILAEYGLEFPDSVEVQVHENTHSLMNYVVPQASEIPQGLDLEEIEPMAGKVMKLALADEAFKTKLLSDPKSAIAKAMGLTLPESLEIRVYEDTPTVKHLVLPVNPFNSELSDADLELVAGGKLSPEQNKAICDGVGTGFKSGCEVAAFTTPIAMVASGVAAGSTQAASAIAS
ncbi:MAG TPA: NHLP leader peptide family RiPP precursor [Allocoleopsis sp.]